VHGTRRVDQGCAERNLLPFDRRWYTERLSAQHLSQRGLAKRLDIDPAQVSRIFNGRRPLRLDEVPVLARLLDVSVVDIIERAGVPLSRR
jgi:transcriptional regulator with XRE-family HTH domain